MPEEELQIAGVSDPEFVRSFAELRAALGFKGEVGKSVGLKFTVTVGAAGIAYTADGMQTPAVTLPWKDLGRIRDEALKIEAPARRQLGEFVGSLLTLGTGPEENRLSAPVLVVPVELPDKRIEVRASVDAAWGIGEDVEALRP